jgi:dedicator of cytokinesis protein 1
MEKSSVLFKTLAAAGGLESPFPAEWFAIFQSVFAVIYKSTISLSKVLREVYNTESDKNRWVEFIRMLSSVIIAIPGSGEFLIKFGNLDGDQRSDIRLSLAKLLREIWKSLSLSSSFRPENFAAELMGPFVELSLCPSALSSTSANQHFRSMTVDCVVEMIQISHNQVDSMPSAGNRMSSNSACNKNRFSSISVASTGNAAEVIRLNIIEVECIDCLDRLIMTERKGDQAYRDWFSAALKTKLSGGTEYAHFLRSVDKFLGLVFALRKTASKTSNDVADDGTIGADSTTGNTSELALLLANLLHFTALLGRTRIYIKYIHRLVDIQISQDISVAEAGWALKLHADLLDWDVDHQLGPVDEEVRLDSVNRTLLHSVDRPKNSKPPSSFLLLEGLLSSADLESFYAPQSSFRRKEVLYLCIIQLFTIGKHFEHAIELAECLADQYRRTLFDYRKLSRILKVIARLTERILDHERYYPAYYRVAFIGRGWDEDWGLVYGKQFVYRAKEWEKLGEFTERLLSQYPGAKIVSASNSWPPDKQLTESKDRWLQVCMVDLQPDQDRFQQILNPLYLKKIPDQVRLWYENNDSDKFSFSRPFRKKLPAGSGGMADKGDNEFLNLWTETYWLRTEHPFPNFLRRSEVV